MRFINKWSYSCAKGLSQMLDEDHQKKALYYYGFQIALGSIVKAVILVAVSFALGAMLPALTISLAFALLRKAAGGYHMKTYGKCLFVTMVLFISAALIAQYTYQYWSILCLAGFIGLTFFTGMYILIKYAPRDTPNRLITDAREKRKFKIISVIYMLVWLVLSMLLTAIGIKLYAISLCFGILPELFGITPAGHSFFEKIEYGLGRKKQKHLIKT
ncbi:accessory gene regulator B [Ruminiclostridium sufflavum DSM 19573]|uniref:Accessory gene regulator B n=1 Tax=Ruminiclostridium sufflavum DSM 19573 TaxID=1121337 RepID=A0A318XJA2_9FIRM|nr:accessory gene regulator B family protein [Ruminiclostridium sufflavum]PYG86528.1 accessory gene regulator B [Ruminiclostridium sufflavum DSM 19573]